MFRVMFILHTTMTSKSSQLANFIIEHNRNISEGAGAILQSFLEATGEKAYSPGSQSGFRDTDVHNAFALIKRREESKYKLRGKITTDRPRSSTVPLSHFIASVSRDGLKYPLESRRLILGVLKEEWSLDTGKQAS
jgi:hypothetical protein